MSLLVASLGSVTLGVIMFGLSIFLILLVLVQRGKGGGLTGALGGPGGQSAFGSKAGDTFTLITAVSAIVWGLVCAIAMYTLGVPPLSADDEFEFEDDTPAAMSGDTGETTTGPGSIGSLEDLDLSMPEVGDEAEATGDGDAEAASGEGAAEASPSAAEASPSAAGSDPSESADGESADGEPSEGEGDSEESGGTPSVELNPPSND